MYNSGMPTAVDLIRRRQQRRIRRDRSQLKTAGRASLVLFSVASLLTGLVAILISVLYADLTRDLPSLQTLPAMLDPEDGLFATPTTVVDRTGSRVLAVLGYRPEDLAYLALSDGILPGIPADMANAAIAGADPGFYQHPGFYLATLLSPEPDTIALELVSNLLFWDEAEGLRRSLREKLLAAQIVRSYGREQVLEWYLNSADFGHSAFGVEAAARLYFGKSASLLTLAEAAALAAVGRAPDLNPFDTPDLVLARRNVLLDDMLARGFISAEAHDDAIAAPLGARREAPVEITEYSAFLNLVAAQLAPYFPPAVLARGGLTIVTTMDVRLQDEFVCVLGAQLERMTSDPAALPEGCEAARLLPSLAGAGVTGSAFSAEAAAIDPLSGQVLALAAVDSADGPRSGTGLHPPGSLLTPYVYLSAFTRGFSPASLVWDIPAYLPPGAGPSPNLDGGFHGPMRSRAALASDFLVPALQYLNQIGPGAVWNAAALSGLPSLAGESGNLLLAEGELALVEAVHAYGALSTQGVLIGYPDSQSLLDPTPLSPTAVLRVLDAAGRVWLDLGPPQARPVMSAPLAYSLTHVLADESARWPAWGHPNPLEIGRPAGAKTGFTQDRQHLWTVGFTPQVAIGVWVGSADGQGLLADPGPAAGIWHAAVKIATRELPPNGWTAPQGIAEIDVCDPSGLLPTAECPLIVREVFMAGNEPVQADTLFRRYEINRETGLLATVFTPQALIEGRVFMVPPPEALSWAQQAGLDIPPENYDLVSQPPPASPDARVTFPEMFAYVGGEVVIRGSASGADFESYSVQVGQGLNPQQWLQLGEASSAPVVDGELAVWDTAGAAGLYAIRLLVVRTGNLVETQIIQVTVDNQPPELAIVFPTAGQAFTYPLDSAITVQIAASDDLLLATVEVYLDGRLLRSFSQPPYALALDLLPGEHQIEVVARDLAGNERVVELTVVVNR